MRTAIVALVLATALISTGCAGSEDEASSEAAPISTTTTETTSRTAPTLERSTPNYVGTPDHLVSRLRLDPPVVPADVGSIQVVVHGRRLTPNHGMFVHACPNASLENPTRPVDPDNCGGLPMRNGWTDTERARAEGKLANPTTGPDGTFTVPLTVVIDDAAIGAGGLVIRTGCMMIPSTASAVLRIE